uniref:Ribosomal protein S4 n=1 Tax=Phaeophyceae sp. TaxID=2249243 RepID=A0A8E8PF30_9PHAE|nr:ribosomal protein S4 [Phaeophyceae sp.]
MRLKHRYKSCLWSRTDIWGNLITKENSFLRKKWDTIINILASQKNRRKRSGVKSNTKASTLLHDYSFIKPRTRPNQVYKSNRWAFRGALSSVLCLRRFYGDVSHRSFKKLCKPWATVSNPTLNLLGALEGRLDITLWRLGFFHSIYYSRQAILHNKVLVNGRAVGLGSYTLRKGDHVSFCHTQRKAIYTRIKRRYAKYTTTKVKSLMKSLSNRAKFQFFLPPTPRWIQTNYSNFSFFLSSEVCLPIVYPYRVLLEDIVGAAKYGYR